MFKSKIKLNRLLKYVLLVFLMNYNLFFHFPSNWFFKNYTYASEIFKIRKYYGFIFKFSNKETQIVELYTQLGTKIKSTQKIMLKQLKYKVRILKTKFSTLILAF